MLTNILWRLAAPLDFQVEAAVTQPLPHRSVRVALIRCLRSNFSDTKKARPLLAHNFAALKTALDIMDYPGLWLTTNEASNKLLLGSF